MYYIDYVLLLYFDVLLTGYVLLLYFDVIDWIFDVLLTGYLRGPKSRDSVTVNW